VSSLLEILVLDVLQVSSLLGRVDMFSAGLDSLGLCLDAVNDIFGSLTDLIHEGGIRKLMSDELVIRAGLESFTAKSRIVHEDSLEVLESILAGVAEDSEVKGGIVVTRKGKVSIRATDVESSHERISPIVKSEDKSVVVLEVKDTERADSSKEGLVASHFLDLGLLEEKDFDTLDHTGFFSDRFHCEMMLLFGLESVF